MIPDDDILAWTGCRQSLRCSFGVDLSFYRAVPIPADREASRKLVTEMVVPGCRGRIGKRATYKTQSKSQLASKS